MFSQVLSEALAWMSKTVDEFGLPTFNVGTLLSWAKDDLASTNAPVRNAAVALLAICHKQLGTGLHAMVQNDVKPAQWAVLEEAFASHPQQQVSPGEHGKTARDSEGHQANSYTCDCVLISQQTRGMEGGACMRVL